MAFASSLSDSSAFASCEAAQKASQASAPHNAPQAASRASSSATHGRRSPASVVLSALSTVFVALVVVLAVALAGVRVVGLTPFSVLSGSMSPAIQKGDLVYVKAVDPATIQPGQVITYVYNRELTIVTHRVMSVNLEAGTFVTRGDANLIPDFNPVLFENVQGVVVFKVPYLGYVSSFVSEPPGVYALLAVVVALLIAFVFVPASKWAAGKIVKGDTP